MCGILGFYSNNKNEDINLLNNFKIAKEIGNHRGPDGYGIFKDEENQVFLAHHRLSIIDLNPLANQPMMDEKKQNIIIFNGEIYNYEKIRNELNKKDNIQYITNSDTEVLLHFIKSNMNNMKFSFLKELRGIFGAVFYSKDLKKIFIFNDRFGIKPIYIYKKNKNDIFFGSEIKSFIPFLDEKLAININAIKNYITYIYAPGDVTPLEKVTSLPPGSIFTIEVETGKTSLSSWLPNNYEFPNKKNFFSLKDASNKTLNLLRSAVHNQMVSDVPLGTFLSGGLDSSSILRFALEVDPKIKSFTIEYKSKEKKINQDLKYAKKISSFLDADLEIVKVDPEKFIDSIPGMIYQLDLPIADPASLNVFFITKYARNLGIKVLLSGAGGDDIFTGYRRHKALYLKNLTEGMPKNVFESSHKLFNLLSKKSNIARKLVKLLDGINLDFDSYMIRLFQWNSPLLSKSLFNNKYYLDFKSSKDPLEEYVKKMPKDLDWVNKVLCLEKRFFLSNHNLVYTDKMSMANSVEVRVPFLDDDLVNYVNNLPSSLKQNKFISKYLLKKAMEPFLPKEVIYRSKTGFKLPLRSWMENELGDYVMNVLSKENIKNREIFNFKKVQNLIDANYLGKIDASYTILSLVFIEIWFQIFLDKKPYKNLI